MGVNDSTVVNSDEGGIRRPGAAVTVTENGVLLVEGIDYTFGYNETTNEIVLTPLAGIWRDGKVYEITLNNRNRFVVEAPEGNVIADGDQFSVIDSLGGNVVFEIRYRLSLNLPMVASLNVPIAGGRPGGIQDGDRFTISTNGQTVTFEFDSNNTFVVGNVPIDYFLTDTQTQLSQRIIAAIQARNIGITPALRSDGSIALVGAADIRVDTSTSLLTQPAKTLALAVQQLVCNRRR